MSLVQEITGAMPTQVCGSASNLSGLTVSVDQVDEARWNEIVPLFADASIYQTWAYGAVHWGRKQLSHVLLQRGEEVVGAAQVRIVQIPLIRKGVAYVRWGPLWRRRDRAENPEIFRQLIQALKAEYVEKRGLLLRIIPNVFEAEAYSSEIRSGLASAGLERDGTPAYHTIRVDLSKSPEDLRKGLHQRWRNKLKNAEKSGFTVTVGTTNAEYDSFHRAYREMMTRKRFDTTVDPAEFGRMQTALPTFLKMRVLLCEKEGQLLNALVVAGAGDTGIYVLAGTADAGLQANGAFILQWQAINLLKQEGYRWYDLGGVNAERNPGVYQFKSGMGGEGAVQSGLYSCSSNWVSSLCVSAAENIRGMLRKSARPSSASERAPAEGAAA